MSRPGRVGRGALAVSALWLWPGTELDAQTPVRDRIASIPVSPIHFTPPEPRVEEVEGVPVYFLEDRDLPLVTLYATFKGGYARLPRAYYGAANAVPALMRTGGTRSLPPDSVDARIEYEALSMTFGQGGGSMSASVNTVTDNLETAVSLWREMLREPGFDPAQVEVWRGTEVERAIRRRDDPATTAYSRFNRIMFGDHPVGWELAPEDLDPDDLTRAKLEYVHASVVCPENMTLGVVGDLGWEDAREVAEEILAGWPSCSGVLQDEPEPDLRREPGVFVIHREIEQTVVVLAHTSALRQSDSPAFFASRIGNSILGGSGLSSRLANRLRTREGLTYGASSLWTASATRDGLLGAVTRTKPESTLEATRLILAEMDSMRAAPPEASDVSLAVDEIVNGYVFNFQTPLQIVARSIALRNQELPEDWLERYLEGIQDVSPEGVREVYSRELEPERMTILLLGDTTRFDGTPSELGTVTVLPDRPSSPRGSPRFPR